MNNIEENIVGIFDPDLKLIRPWSLDSLDGGSTDAMKITTIEKLKWVPFFYLPTRTPKQAQFSLLPRQTDWTKLARKIRGSGNQQAMA